MRFTSRDNGPAVYVRFKNKNYTVPTYVGETKKCYGGRPFRKHARGSDWQGTCKYKSVYILKCPEGRLITREAYFVLHNFPIFQRKHISGYFKKAWHLLKKEKVVELLRTIFVPEHWSKNDWEYINNDICEIENETQDYETLINKFIGDYF